MDDNRREDLMNYVNNKHRANLTNQSEKSFKQDNTIGQLQKNNQTVLVERVTEIKTDNVVKQPAESMNQVEPTEVLSGNCGNRKPRTKKQRIISVMASVVCIVVGIILIIWSHTPTTEVFTKLEMQISLTNDFIEKDNYMGYLTTYQSNNLLVIVLREEFDDLAMSSDDTTSDYLEVLKIVNDKSSCLTLFDSSANANFF
jgi:hypothetical protein